MIIETISTPIADASYIESSIHDTFDHEGCIFSLRADQDCTLTIAYSQDGSNFDHSEVYAILSGVPFSVHKTNTQRYLKWTVANYSGSDMTYLRASHKMVSVGRPGVETVSKSLKIAEDMSQDDVTDVVDLAHCQGNVSIMGSVTAMNTGSLVLQHSIDNSDWYDTNDVFVISDGVKFSFEIEENVRYIRFKAVDDDLTGVTLKVAFKQ